MKKRFVIHPFLFALFFVLALYSANATEVSFSQVLLPLLVAVAGTAVVLLLSVVLLRGIGRAALLTSIAVILCLSFGHVVSLLDPNRSAGYNFFTPISGVAVLTLLVWAAILGISVYLIRWYWKKRWNRSLPKLTTFLNVASIALLIIPVVSIIVQEARGSGHHTAASDTEELVLSAPETPPDIYYIILDRYASASTLEEKLGFDNSAFLNYLSDKGFYVAGESRCNYLNTEHSLASSLNMEYLDSLAENVGETTSDLGALYTWMKNYRVWRLLKSAGYEFIHIGSWWEPTRENEYADININYGGSLTEFSRLLLKTTAIDPVGRMLGLWGDERETQYERVKYEFDRLSQIPGREGPTFVFAHFLTPHPDYVFQSDGSFLPLEEALPRSYETRYLDQLVATNQMAMDCIDHLLNDSDVPPIIVLQSDEGPYPDFKDAFLWSESLGNNLDLRVKSGILNAYYFPGIDQSVFYPSITPVNSFRLVFNLYFGTSLDLLDDEYYYWHPGQPYNFIDLTDILKGPAT